jgi:Domain of unknown function (DUF4440)
MKIHFLLAVAGLAFSFAFPVVAQQTADPKTIEQFDEFNKKFDEAFNNNDAAALAAFLTEDAVQVTPEGPIYGREAIEKRRETVRRPLHANSCQRAYQQDRSSPSRYWYGWQRGMEERGM